MTKEDAIKYIQNILKGREDKRGKTEIDIALEMAIKALDQESVLSKIRTEIMSKDGLEEALEIIDKYTAENEGME